jgi:hypothetical protein
MENWVPFSQGGATTRPGSAYLGLTKSGAVGRLVPFVCSSSTAFLLEFTDQILRIWQSDAVIAIADIATTYSTIADIRGLKFAQDGNSIYIVHKSHAPKVLTWVTGTTFTYASWAITGNTGMIPFQSSGNYPGDVAFFDQRMWAGPTTNDPQTVWASRNYIYTYGDPWVALTGYDVGMVVLADTHHLYKCITKGVSAAVTGPTGTTADITDGTVHWAYWTDNGNLDFTYFDQVSYTTKQLKAVASWADPDIPELEDVIAYRQVLAPDHAMELPFASDRGDSITQIIPGKNLIVGTVSSEYVIASGISALEPKVDLQSRIGSMEAIQGTMFGSAMLFLQGGGTRLRQYQYTSESEAYKSPDLTYKNDSVLGTSGAIGMDIGQVPDPMIYLVRADGQMAILLKNDTSEAEAWHRYASGGSGLYESVAVIRGSAGDSVYTITNRGTGYRCVEKFDLVWSLSSIPLDSWVNVASSGATVTGLQRFAGKTATFWNVTHVTAGTGEVYSTATVSAGGVLTVPTAHQGDNLIVGVGFTCTLKTMRVNTQGPYGSGFMSTKRVASVLLMVYQSYPFKVGYVNTAALLETPTFTSPYDGNVACPFNGTWDRDAWVMCVQDTPYHATILAMVPEVET